jgi:Zn-finger nucleic acid-binding protein
MECPICKTPLSEQHGISLCTHGHGALVTGKYLADIKTTEATPERTSTNTVHLLSCPHCATTMQKVDYNSADIIIDACAKCQYRWLDAGEISKIKNHKPGFRANDLLFLLDVERMMNRYDGAKDPNARLPIQGWWRGLAGTGRTRLAGIGGQALFGAIHGLLYSKTSMYLVLITLLIFGLLFFLVFTDTKNTFGF